jgi:hypothetical protein
VARALSARFGASGDGCRRLSGSAPQDALSDEEKRNLWKQVANSSGRVYYQHMETGERSWERPENAQVLTLDEVKRLESEKKEDLSLDGPKEDGGSIVMRMIDHFWTIAGMAHKAYWIGAIAAFAFVGYNLWVDFM